MSVNMKQNGSLVKIASLTKAIIPMGLAECYSTEERQVGAWVDGKPLYQRTFALSSPLTVNSNSWATVDTLSEQVNVIDTEGVLIDANNEFAFYVVAGACGTSKALTVYNYRNVAIQLNRITIRYTKPSDTAGSGIWTPNGEQAVHYSTSEQVIGTWVDGKPLYRKVVTGLSARAVWQGTYYPNVGISAPIASVKEIMNARAIMNYDNGVSRDSVCSVIVNNSSNTWTLVVFDDITINTLIVEYTKTTD